MKRIISTLPLVAALVLAMSSHAQIRRQIHVPDIAGFTTLKCDFHLHTCFSDAAVWPDLRVEEALREGLDVITIADHFEYRHEEINADYNRGYDIAKAAGDANGILVIRGGEITRDMPPGHNNAIFLSDCNPCVQKEWRDAFRQAKKQNAFMFWNHPGWARQQPDTTLWWPEHTEILNNGWMQGIEVANASTYFPEAHAWCLEKNLTMLGNSDSHNPVCMEKDFTKGEHRVMTFVLARERSIDAVREALEQKRTMVWVGDLLVSYEPYLREFFEKSIEIVKITRSPKKCVIVVKNNSDIPFYLKKTTHDKRIEYFRTLTIKPQSQQTIAISHPEDISERVINFQVTNLLAAPNRGIDYSYNF